MPRPKLRAFARRRSAPQPLQGTSLAVSLLLLHLDILISVEDFLGNREDPLSEGFAPEEAIPEDPEPLWIRVGATRFPPNPGPSSEPPPPSQNPRRGDAHPLTP